MEQHYRHSSFREKLIDHLFVGELLKSSWVDGSCNLEVARPEVDNRGYDLITEANGFTRHVQLKASHAAAKAKGQNVHVALADKTSGCVVWILFDERTLALGPYLFFGGCPGEPLPDLASMRIARHTKGDAGGVKKQRPDIRVVPRSRFRVIKTIDELREALFGNADWGDTRR